MTPADIDRALPYVPAGITSGDLTDPDDRAEFVEWLWKLYDRAQYGPQDGDTWTVRDGKATIVASNDWAPPAKGTHESDLYRRNEIDYTAPFLAFEKPGGFLDGARWSRTPDHPPAPGVTYWGKDDAR